MHKIDLQFTRSTVERALRQIVRARWLHRLGDRRTWLILEHLLEAAEAIEAASWEICTAGALPGGSSLFPDHEFKRFALLLEFARSSWEPQEYLDILLVDADAPLQLVQDGLDAILASLATEGESEMGRQTPVRAPQRAVDLVVAS